VDRGKLAPELGTNVFLLAMAVVELRHQNPHLIGQARGLRVPGISQHLDMLREPQADLLQGHAPVQIRVQDVLQCMREVHG